MKIGLFFGTFNPIHIGHLIIGQVMVEKTDLDRIWFVVSPHNPFKKRKTLAHEQDRFDMVQAATYENFNFKASDIEFGLPKPSYTIDTLTYISEKYHEHSFSLIMGADNYVNIHKWKNGDKILEYYKVLIYPRPESKLHKLDLHSNASVVECPLLNISATFIRDMVKNRKSIQYLVPDTVFGLIKERNLYVD